MHFNAYDVFYSLYSHQTAAISAILRVMLLLQQYNGTNVVSCVAVTTERLKIIRISVKIV